MIILKWEHPIIYSMDSELPGHANNPSCQEVHKGSARRGMTGIRMKVREWTPRNGASGMRTSERSLGNEGLGMESQNEGFGMESREWSIVIVTCRMILPSKDMKELYI